MGKWVNGQEGKKGKKMIRMLGKENKDSWKNKLYKKNWKKEITQKYRCGDCGVEEGQQHKDFCDLERCPICGGQFLSCFCDVEEKFKKRVPFLDFPLKCDYCGELYPSMFIDDEWEEILPKIYHGKFLCLECWNFIKNILKEK